MGKSDHAGRWCSVRFVVASRDDDDPGWLDELTSSLPSKSWRKGEPRGGAAPPRGTSGWSITTGRQPDGAAHYAIREFLDSLRDSARVIRRYVEDAKSGWGGCIYVALGGRDDKAALTLEPEDLRRVAALGSSLDVYVDLE